MENAEILAEMKLIRTALETIVAVAQSAITPPRTELEAKNVYTVHQFAAEILDGNLSAEWVRDQIAARKIRTISTKPALISHAEAMRFLNGGKRL